MRRPLMWVIVLGAAIGIAPTSTPVLATPAAGFVATTLATGRFGEINVFNKLIPPDFWTSPSTSAVWLSWQRTAEASDVYVQSNVWAPGGSSGWHTHPGHSLIIVTAVAVTAYEGDDSHCRPRIYPQGMGFVDPGGGHVHILRNEGTIEARTVAVQLIPAAATRRVDAPDPGNCSF